MGGRLAQSLIPRYLTPPSSGCTSCWGGVGGGKVPFLVVRVVGAQEEAAGRQSHLPPL